MRFLNLLALLLFTASLLVAPAWAQNETLNAARIESLQAAVDADSALSEEVRTSLTQALAEAQDSLATIAVMEDRQKQYRDVIASGDARVEALEQQLRDVQEAPATVDSRLGRNPDRDALEAEIDRLDTQRAAWIAERQLEMDASAAAAALDQERRERLAQLSSRLQETVSSSTGAPSSDLEQRVLAAQRTGKRQALQAEKTTLELAQRAAPRINSVRTAKLALLDASILDSDQYRSMLQARLAEVRSNEAQQRRAEVRRLLGTLGDAPDKFAAMAAANLALVDATEALAAELESARDEIDALRSSKEAINADASLTRRRLEVAGLKSELGEVMLSRLGSLPDVRGLAAARAQRNLRITELSLATIDTEQMLRTVEKGPLFHNSTGAEAWTAQQSRVAARLELQHRSLLQEKLQAGNRLVTMLVEANQASEELGDQARAYEQLLTANLLWVRNYAAITPDALRQQLWKAQAMISRWDFTSVDYTRLLDLPLLVGLLLMVVLWSRRPLVKRSLSERLSQPIRPRDESRGKVMRALFFTALVVLPLGVTLLVAGRALELLAPEDAIAAGVRQSLYLLAALLPALSFFRRLGDRLGAGRRLLKWNGAKADALTRDLRWMRPVAVLVVFAYALGNVLAPGAGGGALAVIGTATATIMLLAWALRMLSSDAFTGDAFARRCLYTLAAGLVAIAFMHLSGQLFAAHRYLTALYGTIAAVLVVLFVSNVLKRLLLIYRADLERKAREEARAREAECSDDSDVVPEPDEDEVDATTLSEAYEKLLGLFRFLSLGALLWYIWSPALPALAVLDTVELWTAVNASADGDVRIISLSVLLMALLVGVVSLLLTRHLPPLVNVLLIEWSTVTSGGRYATGMIMQYLILGIGFSISLGMLGFQWSELQWLVAALGVGIGFGLQEIVANFISGIIVLFERPIRVGDIIQAGEHEGTVMQINARATVIQTFERKEVMIPNQQLITSVVTNWSLSNTQLRVLVPIGIAYGSDVGRAMHLLREIARGHPEILVDPEPMVTFEDFGDNALVLWLRCYASKDYVRVATELRERIYNCFNDEGIGISFPQRDVHLDASEPIPIRVLSASSGELGEGG